MNVLAAGAHDIFERLGLLLVASRNSGAEKYGPRMIFPEPSFKTTLTRRSERE